MKFEAVSWNVMEQWGSINAKRRPRLACTKVLGRGPSEVGCTTSDHRGNGYPHASSVTPEHGRLEWWGEEVPLGRYLPLYRNYIAHQGYGADLSLNWHPVLTMRLHWVSDQPLASAVLYKGRDAGENERASKLRLTNFLKSECNSLLSR